MHGTEYGDDELSKAMARELKERLTEAEREKRPLRVYCGFDATAEELHLGSSVPMQKLRQFQELNHEVTFVVGNFTALIGDASDKKGLRPKLSAEQVERNARNYADQAFRILDRKRTKVRFNAEWLSKISFQQFMELASNFTIQQFLARDNFRNRWEKGEAVYLHETFYAIMQGFDAHILKADVQVGGSDQLFNIMTASRKVMSLFGERPNIGIILGILPGTDGVIKMSKSLGNHIPINSDGKDMFGKVMSIPDKAMPTYFRMVTRWSPSKIDELEHHLKVGAIHPRDAKKMLAREVTKNFYNHEIALEAEEAFFHQFQEKKVPEEMPEFVLEDGQTLLEVLEMVGFIRSRSEGRRLIAQNGVQLNGKRLQNAHVVLNEVGVLQVGKRKFIRLRKN